MRPRGQISDGGGTGLELVARVIDALAGSSLHLDADRSAYVERVDQDGQDSLLLHLHVQLAKRQVSFDYRLDVADMEGADADSLANMVRFELVERLETREISPD